MKSNILPLFAIILITSSFPLENSTAHAAPNFCSSISLKGTDINQRIANQQATNRITPRKLKSVSSDLLSGKPINFDALEKFGGLNTVKKSSILTFEAALAAAQKQYTTDISLAKTTYQTAVSRDRTTYQTASASAISERTSSLNAHIATAKQECSLKKPSSQVRTEFINAVNNDALTFRNETKAALLANSAAQKEDMAAYKLATSQAQVRLKASLTTIRLTLLKALVLSTKTPAPTPYKTPLSTR